ncbi:hypothetical protein PIB30_013032 [Stylosanthes scabra]|uniref:PB1-like domain-containing protein n=1 Tax=Stylosanthes scabra TaxID=79078 RepID=A0ABU6S5V0_9FABA|nr:hypothetical protein [Stylosanthes scabra]
MEAFVATLIHHGGRLERLATGEVAYVGGAVKKHDAIDVDFVNKEDLRQQNHFEDGLHVLAGDADVNEMCEFTLNHNLRELHIYIDHVVNVPLPADASVVLSSDSHSSSSSSSSSDDGYESTEDSPYRPPPPGFESDNSDGIAAAEKLRKEKGKKVATHKKKKYRRKKRKFHVLSGDGSGFGQMMKGALMVQNSMRETGMGKYN